MTLLEELLGKDDSLERPSHVELHVKGLATTCGLDGDSFNRRRRRPCRPDSAKEQNDQVDGCKHVVLQNKSRSLVVLILFDTRVK